jgi:hypothetical protein
VPKNGIKALQAFQEKANQLRVLRVAFLLMAIAAGGSEG